MNPKFRSQQNKTDMQLPQWLCRLSVGNELVSIEFNTKNISDLLFFLNFTVGTFPNTDFFVSHESKTLSNLSC